MRKTIICVTICLLLSSFAWGQKWQIPMTGETGRPGNWQIPWAGDQQDTQQVLEQDERGKLRIGIGTDGNVGPMIRLNGELYVIGENDVNPAISELE